MNYQNMSVHELYAVLYQTEPKSIERYLVKKLIKARLVSQFKRRQYRIMMRQKEKTTKKQDTSSVSKILDNLSIDDDEQEVQRDYDDVSDKDLIVADEDVSSKYDTNKKALEATKYDQDNDINEQINDKISNRLSGDIMIKKKIKTIRDNYVPPYNH